MSIKAIMFDFDGTLSAPGNSNIWNDFWDICGYERTAGSDYANLGALYFGGKIDYQTWCDLTCEKFVEKNMDKSMIKACADKIVMLKDLSSSLERLKDMGITLGICSGNCDEIIRDVLGEDAKFFDVIQANYLTFDGNDKLKEIYAKFDCFEGKAKFLESFIDKNEVKPSEVLFVGNGENDEWAYLSGVRTLCINPEPKVHKEDRTIWHNLIESTDTLSDVVDFVERENQREKGVLEIDNGEIESSSKIGVLDSMTLEEFIEDMELI